MKNESGMTACDLWVLVKPRLVQEKTSGGLIIPDSTKALMEKQGTMAQVVNAGKSAFLEWGDDAPEEGDWVTVVKFKGVEAPGKDGEMYWFIKADDITGAIQGEPWDAVSARKQQRG